jgi:SAM-dependent MidA family methyltransferase
MSCKSEEDKSKLMADFNMLVNPEKMGERFKLLAFRKFDFKQQPVGFLN